MAEIKHERPVTDADLIGDKGTLTHEETMHLSELTEEEKAIEKKLRFKIDCLIMPLVVLVYLMNYIDRNVSICSSPPESTLITFDRTTLQLDYKALRKTCILLENNIRPVSRFYSSVIF